MDIALKQINFSEFDLAIEGNDLLADNGMRTAIIISLFTNRQAEVDDVIPDGSDNRRGWWGDSFNAIDGDLTGSRLWLLGREKQTQAVLLRAKEYTDEALQWMLDDGVASRLDITTEWLDNATLGIQVKVFKADENLFNEIFEYSLESL